MITINRILYSLFFSLIACYSSVFAQQSLPDLIDRVKPAVVKILVYDGSGQIIATGSGFYVTTNKIITNKHVVESAYSIQIQTSDNKIIPIVKKTDAKNADLALLESSSENIQISPLVISTNIPREGDKVVVVGSPLGLAGSVADGIVSAFRVLKGAGNLLQITAPISPGSSGSPVVNMSGQVIGVATLNVQGGQSLNFAIPSERIISLWGSSVTIGTSSGVNLPPAISVDNQKQVNIQETIRFDGLYAFELVDGGFTYLRFYKSGISAYVNVNGKRDDQNARGWLSDKEKDAPGKANYILKDGRVIFSYKYKKIVTTYDCGIAGIYLKCNIHSDDGKEDFVRIYSFSKFPQRQ